MTLHEWLYLFTARFEYPPKWCACSAVWFLLHGLVQCCLHRNFYTIELCECFGVVSSMKFPNTLTLCGLVLFIFHRVFALSFPTSSTRAFNTSWPCLQSVFLGRFYSVTPEQVERSNYWVSTSFADNAVVIVLLHWSSLIIMRCELNLTHVSANQLSKKSCMTAI